MRANKHSATVYVVLLCFLVFYTANSDKNCSKFCITPACVQLADQFLSKINDDIDPCEDFYGFACGKYPEDTVMTRYGKNEIASQSAYRVMYDRMMQMIESSTDEIEESIANKRKVIYNSCVDFHDIYKEINMMKKRLAEYYIPNWPNIGSIVDDDIDEWLLNFQLADEFSFVNFDINYISPEIFQEYYDNRGITLPPNISTSIEVKLRVESSSMFEICPDIAENQIIDFIYGFMEEFEFLTHDRQKIIQNVIHMDRVLQNITSTDYRHLNYKMNCKNIYRNRWCRMFDRLVERTQVKGNFSLAEFMFPESGMFLAIDHLLKSASREDIANYLAVRFLLKNLGTLSYFSQSYNFPCKTSMSRLDDYSFLNKKLSCTYFVTSYLPLFVVQDYIHTKNIPEKLIILRSLLKQLLNVTLELLDTSWMQENMKKAYLKSLKRTTIDQLDYVPYILSSDINIRYIELKPDPKNFFYNIDAIKRMKRVDELRHYKLGYYYRMLMQLDPFTANAASGEDITLGFGFYEIPYSGPSLPAFVDYARLGYPLAHEIAHNIHYVIILNSENNVTSFEDYKKCVVDMYSNFLVPMLKVPAMDNRTFGENIADLLGKQIAYEAYLNFISQNGLQPRLPGLSRFSGEQLFFILSAQDWCEFGSNYETYLKNMHSPSEHRIKGPSMNLESFSRIFGCKKGSPMNPVKKCQLN